MMSVSSLLDKLPPEARARWRRRFNRLHRYAWLGTLRRPRPLSEVFGFDRGVPVDRFYIEQFMAEHHNDCRGRALEIKDAEYVNRYGTAIESCDVLDIDPHNPEATVVADLTRANTIPSNSFDCFVLTQTLQYIYNTPAAIAHACRILRPGGVLLVTVPALSRNAPQHEKSVDYWRFTVASCTALFGEAFGAAQVQVRAYGNFLTAIAFLAGMAADELSAAELAVHDEQQPLLIAVRAVKAGSNASES
jgi:SAM-dependent methyltransferase